jgi:FkbM family methyltransferase
MISVLRAILRHPLNQRRRLAACQRFIRWQLATRMLRSPVVHTWVGTTRFIVRRGETGLTGNIYCGLIEFEDMAFVLHFMTKGDLFVDVGANAGAYTLLACGVRQADGVAVEPLSATWHRLVDNVRLNQLELRVQCACVGLGATDGVLHFTKGEDTVNHVVSPSDRPGGSEQVTVTSLDALLHGRVPTCIKIDVEGYELNVLHGAHATLAQPACRALIVELNGSGRRYGVEDRQIVEWLEARGFTPWRYDPFLRRLTPAQVPPTGTGNVLFLRGAEEIETVLKEAPAFEVLGAQV